MKLYLAGIYTASFDIGGSLYNRLTDAEKYSRYNVENYLESYHYIHRESIVKKIRKDEKKVFLDSGAFSAFTQGVTVDIDAYCRYIKKNEDIILVASVLDGIGDPQQTYENQCYMESQGVKPLPCFHFGEDERYLEYYIANYEYITLGGMVPISTPKLKIWLDRLWDKYLTDSSGTPKVKVHGFGLTAVPLMKRYPWYSVDSSTWVQVARIGNVLIPEFGSVSVSENSPARKVAMQHVNTVTPPMREAIKQAVERRGYTLERLATEYLSRWTFNLLAFKELNDQINHEFSTFVSPQPELF